MKNIKKGNILLTAILIAVIVPYAYTILYAVPSTDDFWMAAGVDKENMLQSAINTANSFWMNWGGMWLYEFLRVFLNPLARFGATSSLLGVELVIWFLNTEVWTEVFYWFVGSAYMWAMTFVLLTVALEMVYFNKPSIWNGTVLSVIGAIAASFYSQAVFPCMIFLLFITKDFFDNKKINLKKIVPFLFFLLGAISSLVAPGNFQRKGASGEAGLGLLTALKDTFVIWLGNLFDLVKNPLAVIMAVFFVLLGMVAMREKKEKYRYPAVPFVLTLMCLFVAYFPFALGYGNSTYLPNRAKFAFNLFAVLSFSASFMYLGGWLKYEKKMKFAKKELTYGVAGLAVFAYVCLIPTQYYQELPYAQTVAQTHQVKVANDEWRYLLNAIEASEEENVEFERSTIYTPIIKAPGITSDSKHSINQNIADFYGKESVCVYWW